MPPRTPYALVGLWGIAASITAGQSPSPSPTPKAPPALRLPFSALVPEATVAFEGASDFAASEDALWVSSRTAGAVGRIDPATNKVLHRATIGQDLCVGLAADFDALFLPRCQPALIARLDTKTNTPGEPIVSPLLGSARALATGIGSVWVIMDARGAITRLDPVGNVAVAEIYTSPGATSLAFGEGALWVANPEQNSVTRINPHNNLIVETIATPNGPVAVTTSEGAVWTWNRSDGSLTRIDSTTNAIVVTVKLNEGTGEARIAAGYGSVWVSRDGAPLTRIDARTNQVAQVFTGAKGSQVTIAHDSLWMAGSPTTVVRLDPKRIEATRTAIPPRPAPSPSPGPMPAAMPAPSPSASPPASPSASPSGKP